MKRGPLALALAAMLACASCVQGTQLVVHVTTAPELEPIAVAVVEVYDGAGALVAPAERFAVGEPGSSFAIVPRGGDATRRVRVVVTGCASRPPLGMLCPTDRVRARSSFRSSFLAGHRVLVRVELSDACTPVECAEGEVCAAGVCEPVPGVAHDSGVRDLDAAATDSQQDDTDVGNDPPDARLVTDAGPSTSRQPPIRPSEPDDGMDLGEVAFGLRMVLLAQGDGWRDIGYDLDGRATAAPSYASECVPPASPRPPEDGTLGTDNVFGASLYPLLEAVAPSLEAAAREAQEAGRDQTVIQIRGWNGTPNDARVRAVIATSAFATSANGSGPDVPPTVEVLGPRDIRIAGVPAPAPAWDQEDWTWLRADAFVGGDLSRPLVIDDVAYVREGVFVARLPSGLELLLPGTDIALVVRVTHAVVTALLDGEGNLDTVTIAGRWSIVDILSMAESVGICRGTGQYNLLGGQLDRIADLRRQPHAPGEPTDVQCEALSVGVTFVGTRVRVAGVAEGAPLTNACAGDAGVLFLDTGVGMVDAGRGG